jgi:hypothetical protein
VARITEEEGRDRRPEWDPIRVPTKRYPAIDDSIVRSLSEVLGRTHGGLTNKEIDELSAPRASRIRRRRLLPERT